MNQKQEMYKELCELGKLGVDIGYPKVFKLLEESTTREFKSASIKESVDTLIHLSKMVS